jgi:translation initiation factor 3 subunit L
MEGVSGTIKQARDTVTNRIQDLIHVSEAKVGRRLVDWYLRNLARTY